MKVILLDNVENVGLAGDVANVKDGYYRNFLSPRSIAIEATAGNLKTMEFKRKKLRADAELKVAEAETVGNRLKEVELNFLRRAADNDRLFGSVSAEDIAEQLIELGYQVDRRGVVLSTPIKQVGTQSVTIKIHSHVRIPIKVIIERELTDDERTEIEEREKAEAERAAYREEHGEEGEGEGGEVEESGEAGAEAAGEESGEAEAKEETTEEKPAVEEETKPETDS